jgi:hypothetical protein
MLSNNKKEEFVFKNVFIWFLYEWIKVVKRETCQDLTHLSSFSFSANIFQASKQLIHIQVQINTLNWLISVH